MELLVGMRYWTEQTVVVDVQLLSHVQLFATLWNAASHVPLSFNISRGRLQFMSIESVMPSKHLVLCHALLLPSLFPSIRVFSSESALGFRWPKYWSFGFSNSPSDEYLELISFRINWFDLLAVQGTLKCLLQYHNSKASIVWHSVFFMVWLSQLYMTLEKIIALTIWTFVSKMMSLHFNTLSKFVIAFPPRGKRLLVSWLQSPSTVILEPKKRKSVSFYFSISICHEVMGLDAMIFVFWMLSFKPAFSLSSFTFIKRLISSSSLSARRAPLHIWGYWHFSWQSWFQLVLHPAQHFAWCTLCLS